MKRGIVIAGLVVVLASLAAVRAYYSRWNLYRGALLVFEGGRPSSLMQTQKKDSDAGVIVDDSGRIDQVGLACKKRVSNHALAACTVGQQTVDYIILHQNETFCDLASYGVVFGGTCSEFLSLALRESPEGLSPFLSEEALREKVARLSLAFQLRQAWTEADTKAIVRDDGIVFLEESVDERYIVTVVLPPQYIITVHYSVNGPRPIDMIEHFQVWRRSSLKPD